MLINSLLGRVKFSSGISMGTGKTTQQQSHDGPMGVRIFDTPGILDTGTGANPAAQVLAALDAALSHGPMRLVIVAGVSDYLQIVRYADVEMIKIVTSLVHQRMANADQPIEFSLILNQARGRALKALQMQDQRDAIVKDLCGGQMVPNIYLLYLKDVDGEDDVLLPRDQIIHVFEFLKKDVRCLNQDGQLGATSSGHGSSAPNDAPNDASTLVMVQAQPYQQPLAAATLPAPAASGPVLEQPDPLTAPINGAAAMPSKAFHPLHLMGSSNMHVGALAAKTIWLRSELMQETGKTAVLRHELELSQQMVDALADQQHKKESAAPR
ncbi:hypothetical protein GGF31_003763, partial [Allomyces arbusculus]